MAPKGKKPKINDSMFPFHKVAETYFKESLEQQNGKNSFLKSDAEIASQHRRHDLRKNYEKAEAEYKAGKRLNSFGLYRGETIKETTVDIKPTEDE